MKSLIVLIFVCFSNLVLAMNFSGAWSGKGYVDINHDAVSGIYSCSEALIDISHTNYMLNINRDIFNKCDSDTEYGASFSGLPFALTIEDNKLFYHDREIGFISNNTIMVDTKINGWNISASVMVEVDGTMKYSYKSSHPGTNQNFLKTAVLFR